MTPAENSWDWALGRRSLAQPWVWESGWIPRLWMSCCCGPAAHTHSIPLQMRGEKGFLSQGKAEGCWFSLGSREHFPCCDREYLCTWSGFSRSIREKGEGAMPREERIRIELEDQRRSLPTQGSSRSLAEVWSSPTSGRCSRMVLLGRIPSFPALGR